MTTLFVSGTAHAKLAEAGTLHAPARTENAPRPNAVAFVHPGVQVDKAQLDFVKAKLAAHAEPWTGALAAMKRSRFAALTYKPKPRANVECGPVSRPDHGCTDEKNDAIAAYTHALLWYFTGDRAHARKAIEIMNAWAATLVKHTNSNAPLQAAWAASTFPRAAEIIRYTYDDWAKRDVDAFRGMLSKVYMPLVDHGSPSNGNWELSMIEASMGIAVFLDDRAAFATAVSQWHRRVPAYVYLTSDGATPVSPPQGNKFWYNQTRFVDGLSQETCRDLGHVQYGLAAMTNAAETATIQGVDLFAEQSRRLRLAYEFHARFLNGAQVPGWLCGGKLNSVSPDPMWEVGYNALVNRGGLELPETKRLLQKIRPTNADHHMAWETLTHAEIGNGLARCQSGGCGGGGKGTKSGHP
ncbi:MAG TPA: alginate lyase family protein [Kofleriaceae bacterium]